MAERGNDMDAVRTAEFKEAFDEFDKVTMIEKKLSSYMLIVAGSQRRNLHRRVASCPKSHGSEPNRR